MSAPSVLPLPGNGALDEFTHGIAELFDGFGEACLFLDQNWRIRFVNLAAERIYGAGEQLIGRVIWDHQPDLLGAAQETALRKAMAERVSIQMEAPSTSKPGVTVALRIFPVGQGLGLSCRDVTDENAALAREQQQARRLELVFAASGLGEWEWDLITGVVTYSERAAAIYGVPAGLSTIEASRRLQHPDDAARIQATARAAIAERSAFEVEFRAVSPTRGEVWCMLRARAEYDENGVPLKMLGVVADISRMKAQEALIRESEARFRAFAESAPAPLWVTNPAGDLEFANQSASSLQGVTSAGSSVRGVLLEVLHPDDLPGILRIRSEAWAKRQPYEVEARLRDHRGDWRWLRMINRPRHDQHGAFLGYIGMAMDMTEIREAEARQRLLINELNHRVKNTLATVQSIAHQTLREALEPAAARETFVDRLLALSAAHNVLTRENWEGADLSEIAAEAMRPYDEADGKRIHINGPEAQVAPQVALGLSMALHELATNAAKHGALSVPGGRVSLAWRLAPNGAAVEVRWREGGGPPVSPPQRRGFGTRLLTQGLAVELGRPAELEYRPEGVVCTLRAPIVCGSRSHEAHKFRRE